MSSSLASSSRFPHENPRGDFPVSQDDDARKLDEYLKVFHCVFDEYLIKHKRSGARKGKTLAKGCYLLLFHCVFLLFFISFSPKTSHFPGPNFPQLSCGELRECKRIKQNQLTLPCSVFAFGWLLILNTLSIGKRGF